MFKSLTLTDYIGIVGSLVICAAYLAVSSGWMNAESAPYQICNAGGSILLLYSLYHRPNPGAILIEALWLMIALWSLFRIYLLG